MPSSILIAGQIKVGLPNQGINALVVIMVVVVMTRMIQALSIPSYQLQIAENKVVVLDQLQPCLVDISRHATARRGTGGGDHDDAQRLQMGIVLQGSRYSIF